MPKFETLNDIPLPPATVFEFITDLSRWSLYRGHGPFPGIVEASLPPGQPWAVGAKIKIKTTDGNTLHNVVTSFVPGRRYSARMDMKGFESAVLERVDEDMEVVEMPGGGTRVTRRLKLVATSWFTKPLVRGLKKSLRRAIEEHDRVVKQTLIAEQSG